MIGKTFWTTVAIMLACSAGTAADIRRVVTALGNNDKAIALFDSRMALDREAPAPHRPFCGRRIRRRRDCRSMTIMPPSRCLRCRRIPAARSW